MSSVISDPVQAAMALIAKFVCEKDPRAMRLMLLFQEHHTEIGEYYANKRGSPEDAILEFVYDKMKSKLQTMVAPVAKAAIVLPPKKMTAGLPPKTKAAPAAAAAPADVSPSKKKKKQTPAAPAKTVTFTLDDLLAGLEPEPNEELKPRSVYTDEKIKKIIKKAGKANVETRAKILAKKLAKNPNWVPSLRKDGKSREDQTSVYWKEWQLRKTFGREFMMGDEEITWEELVGSEIAYEQYYTGLASTDFGALYRTLPQNCLWRNDKLTEVEVRGMIWALEQGAGTDTIMFLSAIYVVCVLPDGTLDFSRMDEFVPEVRLGYFFSSTLRKRIEKLGFSCEDIPGETTKEDVRTLVLKYFTPFQVKRDITPKAKGTKRSVATTTTTMTPAEVPKRTKVVEVPATPEPTQVLVEEVPATPQPTQVLVEEVTPVPATPQVVFDVFVPPVEALTFVDESSQASQDSHMSGLSCLLEGPGLEDEPVFAPGTPLATYQEVPIPPTQVISETQLVDEMDVEEEDEEEDLLDPEQAEFLQRFPNGVCYLFPDNYIGQYKKLTRKTTELQSPSGKAFSIEALQVVDCRNIAEYWDVIVNKE